jgi:hypothetical protein
MSPRKRTQPRANKNASGASELSNFERLIERARLGMPEQDYRLNILNVLLRTPHRNVAPYMPLFADVHERDPLFFVRLAAWYNEVGAVHDLKQLFI